MSTSKMLRMVSDKRNWFSVNLDAETPELLIYDVIGTGMWGDDAVSPVAFRKALQEIEKKHTRMNLRINSPGGIVHDGFTIYNALKDSPLEITAYIDGLAASCASWIAMAANKTLASPQSEMMIHNAWGIVLGTSEEMRKEADHLDSLTGMIAGIYAAKTGMKEDEIKTMMNATTWMSGAEAVELGFADELTEQSMAAACAFDLDPDILPGLPSSFKAYQTALKKRAAEQSLRDAGASRAEAARCASLADNQVIKNQASETLKREIEKCLKQL